MVRFNADGLASIVQPDNAIWLDWDLETPNTYGHWNDVVGCIL